MESKVPITPSVIDNRFNTFDTGLNVIGNNYFNQLSAAYDTERETYDMLVMESINVKGLESEYFVVEFDKTKDRIFGEDTNQYITRKFDFSCYTKMTSELENQNMFGLWGNDDLIIDISIEHFKVASSLHRDSYIDDPSRINRHHDTVKLYDSLVPRAGDIFKFKFNERFYVITNVKQTKTQFKLGQHLWTVNAKVFIHKNFDINSVQFIQNGNQIWQPVRDVYGNPVYGNQGPQAPSEFIGSQTQEQSKTITEELTPMIPDILEVNDELVGNQFDNVGQVLYDEPIIAPTPEILNPFDVITDEDLEF